MNSKKRPQVSQIELLILNLILFNFANFYLQVLSFENNDVQVYEDASQDLEDIRIMFKIGDDLRQVCAFKIQQFEITYFNIGSGNYFYLIKSFQRNFGFSIKL